MYLKIVLMSSVVGTSFTLLYKGTGSQLSAIRADSALDPAQVAADPGVDPRDERLATVIPPDGDDPGQVDVPVALHRAGLHGQRTARVAAAGVNADLAAGAHLTLGQDYVGVLGEGLLALVLRLDGQHGLPLDPAAAAGLGLAPAGNVGGGAGQLISNPAPLRRQADGLQIRHLQPVDRAGQSQQGYVIAVGAVRVLRVRQDPVDGHPDVRRGTLPHPGHSHAMLSTAR